MKTRHLVRDTADIKRLGTICGIWAHPDDESFSCGGLMAAAVEQGQTVICVTATRGEKGVRNAERWPPEQLAEIRAAEMAAGLRALGVTQHYWLDYPDGGCARADRQAAVAQIVEVLKTHQPDTILTFGPDGLTGHTDHQTVSAWAHEAAVQTGRDIAIYHVVQSKSCYDRCLRALDERFDLFFNINQPPLRDEAQCDICLPLNVGLFAKKMEALAAMPSQTEDMLTALTFDELMAGFSIECFEAADDSSQSR